jgi:hypothetical protein
MREAASKGSKAKASAKPGATLKTDAYKRGEAISSTAKHGVLVAAAAVGSVAVATKDAVIDFVSGVWAGL